MGADRQLGPAARLRAAPGVREREPREGDAARGLPARHRQPHADAAERASLGPMITESSNDAADTIYYRVGDAALYDVAKRAGMRASRSPATGATRTSAPRTRRASSTASTGWSRALARLRARPPVLDRLLPALGLLALRSRAGFRTFFKGGWRGTAPASSCTRRRCSSAVTRASRWRCSPTATRRTTTARRRCGAWRSAIFAPAGGLGPRPRAGAGGGRHARHPPRRPRRRPPLRPGIRVDLDYRTKHNDTGRPLPGYCENWALMHRRAAFSLGQVQRYLRRNGLGLLILDAYRPRAPPRRSSAGRSAPGAATSSGTYIARRSRHNTGSAVDLTLVRAPGRQAPPDGRLRRSARARTPTTPAAASCATGSR